MQKQPKIKNLSREQILWESSLRNKVIESINVFHDDSIKDHMIVDIPLTSKQRSDVHEYVKTKGIFTQTIDIPGSQHKKIVVLRTKDTQVHVPVIVHTHTLDKKGSNFNMGPDAISFFIDYTGISIPVNDLDTIEYFLDLYDELYDAKNKWELFTSESKTMCLKDEVQRVKKEIIRDIMSFQGFDDLMKQKLSGSQNLLKREPYTHDKVGKFFISIDIRAGNFTVLRDQVPEIFQDSCESKMLSWQEYVGIFTESKFITDSKFFREIVFGLIPGYMSKARILQELFMDQIHCFVKESDTNDSLTLVMKLGDELIYEIKDYWNTVGSDTHSMSIDNIIELLKEYSSKLHFRVYELNSIRDKPWYYKTWLFNDGPIIRASEKPLTMGTILEFKGVPKIFKAQVVKWYKSLPVEPNDLLFTHEGLRARFEHQIF